MSDAIFNAAVYGILLPAFIGAITWWVAGRLREELDGHHPWAGAFAVAVSFHVGYVALNWKGGEAITSLLGFVGEPKETGYIVAAAIVVGLIDSLIRERKPVVESVVFAGIVVGLMYLLVGDLFGDPWSGPGTALRIGIVGVGFSAMRWTLEDRAHAHPGLGVPLVLTVIGTGAALILALRGTARIGQHIGILTAVAGAAIPIAWWRSSLSVARGGVAAFVVVLAGLFMAGYFYMYGAPMYASLLWLLAPQAVWFAEIGPIGELSGWKATLSRVMCVTMVVGGAVVIAAMAS